MWINLNNNKCGILLVSTVTGSDFERASKHASEVFAFNDRQGSLEKQRLSVAQLGVRLQIGVRGKLWLKTKRTVAKAEAFTQYS